MTEEQIKKAKAILKKMVKESKRKKELWDKNNPYRSELYDEVYVKGMAFLEKMENDPMEWK